MFKLYYAPGTCALASHIALEEAGASYAAERLDFKNSQQTTPQYLAINPKGRVPALVTDRGTLTETPAILVYIAQSFPQARLVPDDPFAFAQAQSFLAAPAPFITRPAVGKIAALELPQRKTSPGARILRCDLQGAARVRAGYRTGGAPGNRLAAPRRRASCRGRRRRGTRRGTRGGSRGTPTCRAR